MPRYFFHLHDDMVSIDEEGTELPDIAAARKMAVEAALGLMSAQVLGGRLHLDHRIEVEDENRRPVLSLPFKEAVEIEG